MTIGVGKCLGFFFVVCLVCVGVLCNGFFWWCVLLVVSQDKKLSVLSVLL